jgi:hypothetical protein
MAYKKTSGEKIGEVVESYAVLSESPTSNWTTQYCSISWKGASPKKEIRKMNTHPDGDEGDVTFGKGISFNSDEELDILTECLVSQGYGDTKTLKNELKNR